MTACYVCLCSGPDFVLGMVNCKLKSCLSRELVIFIWVTVDSKLLSCHVLTENEGNKEAVSGVLLKINCKAMLELDIFVHGY